MSNVAEIYCHQGKYAQAEALGKQTLEIRRRTLSPEHPDILTSMNNLAEVYGLQGQYAQAEALFNQTLEIRRRVLGAEHPDTLVTLSGLATIYQRQAKYDLAEPLFSQVLAERRHALGSGHPDTMDSAYLLALANQSRGKFSDAEPLAREVLDFYRKEQSDDWQRFRSESLLGASLAGQKIFTEAEPLLLEGYRGMLARKDRIAVPDRYYINLAREWIAQFCRVSSKQKKIAACDSN
jgi:tetratricopeptide (TPR) repeat protein